MTHAGWSKDVVAVVTGGNKGIGYEIVKGLAKAGVTVVLTARDEGRGTAAAKTLNAEGLNAIHYYPLTVDDANSVKNLATWLGQQFGGIDILVNNAGIYIQSPLTIENATKTFETNLWGVKKVTEGLLPLFKPTGLRRIVNVSSRLGLIEGLKSEDLKARFRNADNLTLDDVEALAQKYLRDVKARTLNEWVTSHETKLVREVGEGIAMYPESKVLLNAYSRVLAKSLASKEVFVNVTCPGLIATDLNGMIAGGKTPPEGADTIVWLALLPIDNYPTGKFFAERKEIGYEFRGSS